MNKQKPLFIPLKTQYYQAFADGSKTEELRLYGPRWNHDTCWVGREVILSKGYGKQSRMRGEIIAFRKTHGSLLDLTNQTAVTSVYGTLDVVVAVIVIADLQSA